MNSYENKTAASWTLADECAGLEKEEGISIETCPVKKADKDEKATADAYQDYMAVLFAGWYLADGGRKLYEIDDSLQYAIFEKSYFHTLSKSKQRFYKETYGRFCVIEAGKNYHMHADEAAAAATDSVEPIGAAEAVQPDEADVVEPADTTADVPAQRKHRGRAPTGKFATFCSLYPDYLRGELGVTSMAREIGCAVPTVYTYLRKMRAMVDATIAADAVTDRE